MHGDYLYLDSLTANEVLNIPDVVACDNESSVSDVSFDSIHLKKKRVVSW